MTESFELHRRTPAGQLRYLAEQVGCTNGLDPDDRTRLAAVRLQLEQLADELDESVAVQDMRGLVPARVGKTADMRRLAKEAAAAGSHVHIISRAGQTCVSGDCEATGEQR